MIRKYLTTMPEFTLRILVCSLCMIVSACVTINIYFPAAATEKAADKIIDEIWQSQPNTSSSQESVSDIEPTSNK